MQAPITIALIAVTCVVSWMAFNNRKLMDRLILWPPAIERHKQYDRLVGYGFIHADFMHLLFNMFTLFFFGRVMEGMIMELAGSPLAYLGFYLAALVVSILPTYLKHQKDPNYRSLGASGAVSAVLFAFILVDPWATIGVMFIPMPAIVFAVLYVGYSIWMDKRGGDNVNHGAHLAGAAFGVLFMVIMEPRVLGHFLQQLGQPRFGF
jgi:membrane associated rhomboid family serine protease